MEKKNWKMLDANFWNICVLNRVEICLCLKLEIWKI